jgi:hypothetical protein
MFLNHHQFQSVLKLVRVGCWCGLAMLLAGCGGEGAPMAESAQPIEAGSATVVGRVTSTTGVPLKNVNVRFYAPGRFVKAIRSGANGVFTLSLPLDTNRLNVQGTTFPPGFYRSYSYRDEWFTGLELRCWGPLPPLKAGATVRLANIKVPALSGPPPPPPLGCRA